MAEPETIRAKADAAIALVRFGADLKASEAEALVAEVEHLRAELAAAKLLVAMAQSEIKP